MGSRYTGIELHFLAIEERGLGRHRARRHHVAVGEDEAALGIDHEAGGLRGGIPLRIERARLVDLDGDHALGDSRQGSAPRGAFSFGLRQRGLGGAVCATTCGGAFCAHACGEKAGATKTVRCQQAAWVHAVSFRLVRRQRQRTRIQITASSSSDVSTAAEPMSLASPDNCVALEPDAINRGLDGAVDQFHDEHDEHRRDQQCPLDAIAP